MRWFLVVKTTKEVIRKKKSPQILFLRLCGNKIHREWHKSNVIQWGFCVYCACLCLLSLQICETIVDHICRTRLSSSAARGYVCSPGYCFVCWPGDQAFLNWQVVTQRSSCAHRNESLLLLQVKWFYPAIIPGSPWFSYSHQPSHALHRCSLVSCI